MVGNTAPGAFNVHATSKRDREIAAEIDRRLAEAGEDDEPDNGSDDDGSSGVRGSFGLMARKIRH